MHAKLQLPDDREWQQVNSQWTDEPVTAEPPKPETKQLVLVDTKEPPKPIIVPTRFLYQRGDASILFSIETVQKLERESPQTKSPSLAAAYAATFKKWGATPPRVSPLIATFVPVLIPAPASETEKWLWRSTAAAAAMLVLFFVATVAVLLIARPH